MKAGSRTMNAVMLVALLLAGTAVSFGPAFFASRSIRQFCAGVGKGSPREEVVAHARQQGLDLEEKSPQVLVVEHPRSMGRAYCVVRFDATDHATSATPAD